MLDISEYIILGLLVAIGTFGRQLYVYIRKYGFDFALFEKVKLLDSFIATVVASFLYGALNEFLALGVDSLTLSSGLLALLFGVAGNDIFHQLREGYSDR